MGTLNLSEASDAAPAVAIGHWHQEALTEAYRRHAGTVFAVARRVLGDRARAEEVVQEVFVRLWNQPEKFDPGRGSLRSFILVQTHGRAVDLVREAMDELPYAERQATELVKGRIRSGLHHLRDSLNEAGLVVR